MAKKEKKAEANKVKIVVNTKMRGIYATFRTDNNTLRSQLMHPGLNRVPAKVLQQMMKQSAFRRLVDNGTFSGKAGDVDLAKDVEELQRKGKDSTEKVKPEASGNSSNKGADLASSEAEATNTDESGKVLDDDGKPKKKKRKK